MKIKDGNKIPDIMVWDESFGYDAKTKQYPTNLGAPSFEVPDIALIKNAAGRKMINVFESQRQEIINKMKDLFDDFETSVMVWNSKISFEPIVGKTYHLYNFKSGLTLSLISPDEWSNANLFIGSYTLTSENKWKQIN